MTWNDSFTELFDRCLAAYQAGNQDFNTYYTEEDLKFLGQIGYKPREFFDFVEDFGDSRVPSPSTALLIASVRRDYFLVVQHSHPSDKRITRDEIPGFDSELEGINYLPRIIAKAEAKLRGELDPDLMFSCGGDRSFLRENGDIHPADFLRHIWAADGDYAKVAKFVKKHQG